MREKRCQFIDIDQWMTECNFNALALVLFYFTRCSDGTTHSPSPSDGRGAGAVRARRREVVAHGHRRLSADAAPTLPAPPVTWLSRRLWLAAAVAECCWHPTALWQARWAPFQPINLPINNFIVQYENWPWRHNKWIKQMKHELDKTYV